jgi:hypothetical protein
MVKNKPVNKSGIKGHLGSMAPPSRYWHLSIGHFVLCPLLAGRPPEVHFQMVPLSGS